MTATPHQTWSMPKGTAWAFLAGDRLVRPVVLVGHAGTPLDALAARVDDGAYSLLSELKARRFDLVLVGLDADGSLAGHGAAVQQAVMETMARQESDERLAVGGTGQGALAARYALASMEYQRIDHQTAVLFSHNGAAPALEDEAELSRMGGRPQIPMTLRLVDSGVSDGLSDDDVDYTTTGEAPAAGGPLLSKEYGSWLLDNLPR